MTPPRSVPVSVLALLAIAGALIAAAVIEIGPRTTTSRSETQVITAENGVVQSTVTGTGNVEPAVDDTVNFKASGTLQDVLVHVGQHVRQGQLLATLDPTSAKLSLAQAEENLTAARDQLASAQSAETAASTPTTSTTTTTSPATTPTSPATTPTSSAGSSSGGVTEATRAGGSFPAAGAGRSSGATGATGAQTEVITKTVTVTQPSPSTEQSSAASVAQARASVDSAQAAVTSAQQAVRDTNLYAPAGGTIVSMAALSTGDAVSAGGTGNTSSSGAGSSSSGSSTAAGGLGSSTGNTSSSSSSGSGSSSSGFAEIVDTSQLTMTVPFSESDISKIHVGQPADVTLDALAGVELGGHVSAISTVGTTSSSVVSYDATITLDQTDKRVRPGMSASAAVVIGQAQGVTLPNSAVTGNGSTALVQLRDNGRTVPTQVVVGLRGDSRTQILSGLRAGQQVSVTTTLPALGQSSALSSASSSGTLGGGLAGAGGLPGGGFGAGGAGFFRRAAGG